MSTLTSSSTDADRLKQRGTRSVIGRVTTRKAVRSGVVWGAVFGFYIAVQALTYATSYKTPAARKLLEQQFGHNAGISALVGPANQIGTVPGFTAWKCLTVLAIIGSVWGILTSTKLTRGEEDAGRWEVLLVGAVSRKGAATQALLGMAAGVSALFVTTSILSVAVGRDAKVGISAGAAVYFSVAIVSGAIMFLCVGAFASQLSTSRRQAAGLASVFLGASYALRMIADSSGTLGWLRWATPLGWIENLQPLTTPHAIALVPVAALVTALALGTVFLAGRRDLGAGVLSDRSTIEVSRRLPSTPLGLTLYLTRAVLLAWTASILAYGLLLGGIAKSGGKIITSSPSLRRAFARLGVSGAEAYLSVALLLMAVVMSFIAVGQISAARKEESSGQLENLLVRPLSRTVWLAQRVALGIMVLVVGGLFAGLATWVGAVSDHASVHLSSLLNAGLNVAFPALLLFGVGVLVLGVAPRFVSIATYSIFVWFLLIELVGSEVKMNHWVLDLSAFHQMAASPAAPVAWSANAIMAAIALASMLLGVAFFRRRDLKGE